MLLKEFIDTAFFLTINGKIDELVQFITISAELLNRPTLNITVGKPVDKEI